MTKIKVNNSEEVILCKKDLIENHCEFLSAMNDYENKLSELIKDIQFYLYYKYNAQVSRSYISYVLKRFIN